MKQILTLSKGLETDRYELPTVTYWITTQRDTSLRLRLREQLPEEISQTEVRFPSLYVDDWTVEESHLRYESRIEPGEALVTTFGIKTDNPAQLDVFDGCPAVEVAPVVSAPKESEQVWRDIPQDNIVYQETQTGEQTSAKTSVITDGGERSTTAGASSPPVDDDQSETGSSSIETSSADDLAATIPTLNDSDTSEDHSSSPRDELEESGHAVSFDGDQQATGDIVDEFLTALQNTSLSKEQQETLREAIRFDTDESMNARIQHCQTQLSDLEAYIDPLEEFLDEEGFGQQLIKEVQGKLTVLEEEVTVLESTVTTTISKQEELETQFDDIERTVDAQMSEFDETADSLHAEIDSVWTTVKELEDWQKTVATAFTGPEPADEA